MSRDIVISARNVGKKYALAHERPRYYSLRDTVASATARLISRLAGKTDVNDVGEFWALREVDFDIYRGEVIGIIGRNGAGKSTLLKILSRITKPDVGTITIKGRVGSLLEVGTGFHPELTGRENVFLNGAILGMPKREIARKFDEIVSFAEVERFLDMPVKHYSTGMYMRLAFSVAAHLEPSVLIVDEVLAVGDSQFQKKCLGKMEEVSGQGRTVLLVSHNMGVISALCTRCMLMSGGRVELFGETQQVIAAYGRFHDRSLIIQVTPDMRNRGDGRIVFVEALIGGVDMVPRTSFLIGENIRLEIKLVSKFAGAVSFWLIIFDETGRPLLSSHQRDIELVQIREGQYVLTYETVDLGLMPGNYSIAAGAFDRHLNFLEWIDNIQRFEVLPCFLNGEPYDTRWGAVTQKARWALSAAEWAQRDNCVG
jgi:lipopolysaccharide transport system ATP-binding protein